MTTSISLREFQDPDSNGHIELRVVSRQESRAQETMLSLEFEDVKYLTHVLVGFLRGKGIKTAETPNWPMSR